MDMTGGASSSRRSGAGPIKTALYWIVEASFTVFATGYVQAIFLSVLIVLAGRLDAWAVAGGWGLSGVLALIGGALGELIARGLNVAANPWWRYSGPIALALAIVPGLGGRSIMGPTLFAGLYLVGQYGSVRALRTRSSGTAVGFRGDRVAEQALQPDASASVHNAGE